MIKHDLNASSPNQGKRELIKLLREAKALAHEINHKADVINEILSEKCPKRLAA